MSGLGKAVTQMVERYELSKELDHDLTENTMDLDPEGFWVKYSDFKAIEDKLDSLTREHELLKANAAYLAEGHKRADAAESSAHTRACTCPHCGGRVTDVRPNDVKIECPYCEWWFWVSPSSDADVKS